VQVLRSAMGAFFNFIEGADYHDTSPVSRNDILAPGSSLGPTFQLVVYGSLALLALRFTLLSLVDVFGTGGNTVCFC
jgi:hypothetical protein